MKRHSRQQQAAAGSSSSSSSSSMEHAQQQASETAVAPLRQRSRSQLEGEAQRITWHVPCTACGSSSCLLQQQNQHLWSASRNKVCSLLLPLESFLQCISVSVVAAGSTAKRPHACLQVEHAEVLVTTPHLTAAPHLAASCGSMHCTPHLMLHRSQCNCHTNH
jgi:hypothetical protein